MLSHRNLNCRYCFSAPYGLAATFTTAMTVTKPRPEAGSTSDLPQEAPRQSQDGTGGTDIPASIVDTANGVSSEATKSKEREDASLSSSIIKPAPFQERTRDFWILPIPKRVRYHPDRPFVFSLAMNYLFAFVSRCSRQRSESELPTDSSFQASTFTVANLSVIPDDTQ